MKMFWIFTAWNLPISNILLLIEALSKTCECFAVMFFRLGFCNTWNFKILKVKFYRVHLGECLLFCFFSIDHWKSQWLLSKRRTETIISSFLEYRIYIFIIHEKGPGMRCVQNTNSFWRGLEMENRSFSL